MITGATRLVGLLGDPISGSLSPRMQNAAFAAVGLDWAYVPLHQQALAWGVSKKVKVVQRADNQILFYWFRKE